MFKGLFGKKNNNKEELRNRLIIAIATNGSGRVDSFDGVSTDSNEIIFEKYNVRMSEIKADKYDLAMAEVKRQEMVDRLDAIKKLDK